ncbi:MAG: hypothetical protein ACLRO5_08340 [Collinsella sp.]|uniref:hypothetical protein n=1 Tax=Collinsella sp. TaxID=1965294 RepID=UPI0039904BA3
MFKGRDLSGTCGIPRESDRVYVAVECPPRGLNDDVDVPKRLIWPDGRSWPIKSTARHVEHGRTVFGNLVERFDVFMGHTGELKTIWRQDGRWFVAKPGHKTPRPPLLHTPRKEAMENRAGARLGRGRTSRNHPPS